MPQKLYRLTKGIFCWIIQKLIEVALYTWQCAGLYVIAMINNKYCELGFMLLGFCVGKIFFNTSNKHAGGFVVCTLITWCVFWVLTRSTLTLNQSIGVPIMLGMLSQYVTMLCGEFSKHIKIVDKSK